MINHLDQVKKKVALAAIIVLGLHLFSMGPAMAAVPHMDSMDCPAQTLCCGCSTSVISVSPKLEHFFHILQNMEEPTVQLAVQHIPPLFHPPR